VPIQKLAIKTVSLSIQKSAAKNFVVALPIQKSAAKNYAAADLEIGSQKLCRC
jgi:hypothetical protein